jgi:winged helix-turn helix protein
MRGRKKTFAVQLTEEQRSALQRWLRAPTLSAGLARRARLFLLLEEPARTLKEAAQTAGLAPRHARQWVLRFLARGLDGLYDDPRPGRRPVFSPRGRAALGQDRVRATG